MRTREGWVAIAIVGVQMVAVPGRLESLVIVLGIERAPGMLETKAVVLGMN